MAKVVVRARGAFDEVVARSVAEAVRNAGPDDTIRVDLTRVTSFDDLAIAFLARALQDLEPAKLEVTGLRDHQLKLLHYLRLTPGRKRKA